MLSYITPKPPQNWGIQSMLWVHIFQGHNDSHGHEKMWLQCSVTFWAPAPILSALRNLKHEFKLHRTDTIAQLNWTYPFKWPQVGFCCCSVDFAQESVQRLQHYILNRLFHHVVGYLQVRWLPVLTIIHTNTKRW